MHTGANVSVGEVAWWALGEASPIIKFVKILALRTV